MTFHEEMKTMKALGIDVGGSGIKGGVVDVEKGVLVGERYRVSTPNPSKPQKVTKRLLKVVNHFDWVGKPFGVGFPSVVRHGTVYTAANISKKWIGCNAAELFGEATGSECIVLNDADAAGVAEMSFGEGKGRKGTVIIITIGTGLGSAIFTDGVLVPNTEFGHLLIRGKDAEHRASDAVRKNKWFEWKGSDELKWKKWAKRLNEYLTYMESLFWPDLFILGGGVSREFEQFVPYLKVKAELRPALMQNQAGIIGAAMRAYETFGARE